MHLILVKPQYQLRIWDYIMGQLSEVLPRDNRWFKLSETILDLQQKTGQIIKPRFY